MKRHITTLRRMHLLSIFLILSAVSAHATLLATGEIRGKIMDEKGDGLIGASVAIIDAQGKNTGQAGAADYDGNYNIPSLMPGKYDLKCIAIGYQTQVIKGIVVAADKPTIHNFQMKVVSKQFNEVVVSGSKYTKRLSEETVSMSVMTSPSYNYEWKADEAPARTRKSKSKADANVKSAGTAYAAPTTGYSSQDIRNAGSLSVQNVATGAAGVTQSDAGGAMTIHGGRTDEVQYIVNGHRLIGNTSEQAYAKKSSKELETIDMDIAPVPTTIEPPAVKPEPVDKTTNESFKEITDNKFLSAAGAPLSTFSIDVDVASYGITRKKISDGILPPHDAVRIEELVNYFPYAYKDPTDDKPFAVHTEFADCPWDASHHLLRIGIQGKHLSETELPPSNLVFLVDVSGSMWGAERLGLIQKSLSMLTDRMRAKDHIALVVYAGNAGLVLPSTSGADKETIKKAINNLTAGGSTAGGAGIELAYKVAVDNFIKDGNNRVMLCTDGDFNVGINGEAALTSFIEEKRKTGVFLSVLGVGTGNYKDREMEVLADKGNGNYAYLDNEAEAKKNLVTQLGGTLNTIAKDVKIQAVFNPACVKSYRLIGYENRKLENRDFSNDKIDAGEIGSGAAVTAIYEVVLGTDRRESTVDLEDKGSDGKMTLAATDLMALRIRYKAPDGDKSQLIESHVSVTSSPLASTSDDFRFAASVASFGMLLRDSPYKGDATYDKAKALAKGALGPDKESYRHDFLTMIDQAKAISTKTALK
jgi:Ca-activated chloride channel family protein